MRATKAYIASLGTTGLLLAFSASLLVVVGTLFAFNAWPGADIRGAVESLVVDEESPFDIEGPEQAALDAAPAAVAVANASGPVAGAGGASGTLPGGSVGNSGSGSPSGGSTLTGDGGAPGGGGRTISGGGPTGSRGSVDTGEPTNDLANTTERATRELGETVGGANPQLGNTVSDTGRALSGIVRDLPDVKAGQGGVQVENLKLGK